MSDTTTTPQRPLRGARPTPRRVLARARAFSPPVAAPPQFLNRPNQISMWGNDVHGDCVTAEEAFAKACNQPEIFITDDEVIGWATDHGVLDGAYLTDVLGWMQNDGFQRGYTRYNDGPYSTVDWLNPTALHSAIAQGPVKLGIAADQLDDVWYAANGKSGWFATGFQPDNNEDHCTALCGYGTIGWLAGQLGVQVPAGVDSTANGYAMFTWNSIGIIDQPSMAAITHEAWVRNPTTVVQETLLPWPVLQLGANAHPVPTLQYLLNSRGAKLTVDGSFGPKTKSAVKKFQQNTGLAIDGVAGPITWAHVIVVCQSGSHSDAVKGVQEEMNYRNLSGLPETYLALDGSYGPKTKTAVVGFQQALHAGIPTFQVDGICGPMTWQAMVSGMLAL